MLTATQSHLVLLQLSAVQMQEHAMLKKNAVAQVLHAQLMQNLPQYGDLRLESVIQKNPAME